MNKKTLWDKVKKLKEKESDIAYVIVPKNNLFDIDIPKKRTITLSEEDISNLKDLLNDKQISKIAFDNFDVWPFTVRNIIDSWEKGEKDVK
ncbi:MAG: hypothetical protein ACOCZ5_01350 [bacterium]